MGCLYLRFRVFIVGLVALLFLSSCSNAAVYDEKLNQSNESVAIMSNDLSFISFCAKEKSEQNRIYFNYPQLKGSNENVSKTNNRIIEFIELSLRDLCESGFNGNLKDFPESWEWDNSIYAIQAMVIDYKVECYGADYLSITFCGLYNRKTAAHPLHYFNSLTIDLKTHEVVTLSDLFYIDSNFTELFENKYKEQFPVTIAERMGVSENEALKYFEESGFPSLFEDDKTLIEALSQADRDGFRGYNSYLTSTGLVVSVPLIFALGSHIEVTIDYNALEQNKKAIMK